MNNKIIGIIGVPEIDSDNFSLTALYDSYKNALIMKGVIPFLIPSMNSDNYRNTKISDLPPLTEEKKCKICKIIGK